MGAARGPKPSATLAPEAKSALGFVFPCPLHAAFAFHTLKTEKHTYLSLICMRYKPSLLLLLI